MAFGLDTKEYLSDPKLTFNNAIDKYVKDDDLLKGALHFIRTVGNDYTHWNKSTSISLPVLKNYVDIIVQIGRVRINGKKARKTLEIVEVLNGFTEDGDYRLLPLFDSKFKGADKHEICPTGKLPTFIDELVEDFGFNIHDLDEPTVKPEPKI